MDDNLCLCLHCIRDDRDPEPKAHRELFLSPGEMEALFASLRDEGYRFALPGEAAEKSGPVCSVTFDDGYYNNRHFSGDGGETRHPLHPLRHLLQRDAPHPLHVGRMGGHPERTMAHLVGKLQKALRVHGSDERDLLNNDTHRPFAPEELEAFAAHPLVRLAPHGHMHQPMVGKYLEGMDREIGENLSFLSGFKNALTDDFSLPCGLHTRRLTRKLLARFKRIYTIDGGGFSPQDRVINRISLINPEVGGPLRGQISNPSAPKRGSCARRSISATPTGSSTGSERTGTPP